MKKICNERKNRLKKMAATASVVLAINLSIIKTIGLFYTGSLAVLSSMVDSLSDLFASSVTFIAVKFSSKPASPNYRYGYGKAEAISALVQSAFVAGSGIFILYDGISRFIYPRPLISTDLGIIIMCISLVLTLCLITFQKYVAKITNSQAIKADAAHYNVDVISNLAIILTLIVVKVFKISWFDSLIAIIISLYILLNGYQLAKSAIKLLMDTELSDDIRNNIEKIVMSNDKARGIHDLRTRDLGGDYLFEFHLELDGDLTLIEAHEYTDEIEKSLRREYPNAQVVIHQEPVGIEEHRLDDKINSEANN